MLPPQIISQLKDHEKRIRRQEAITKMYGIPDVSLTIEAALLITATHVTVQTFHRAINFANAADSYAMWNLMLPRGWGGRPLVARLLWAPSSTNTGNCTLQVVYFRQVAGTTLTAVADGSTSVSSTANGTVDRPQAVTFAAMPTVSILADGDALTFGLIRPDAAAPDTFTGAARVLAVELSPE